MTRQQLSDSGSSTGDAPEIPACDYQAANPFMNLAIAEARTGIHLGHGGPFGAVVVRDGTVIGRGHNMVLVAHDSTCHGEISAIRHAEERLGTHDLSGCELYTTGEPCPMCLAAIMWANIRKVYFGATIHDNALIGFRDEIFDRMFGDRRAFRELLTPLDREACLRLFDEYRNLPKTLY